MQKRINAILIIITLAAVCTAVWAVFLRQPETVILTPDYAPAPEKYAETMLDDTTAPAQSPDGGGSVSLSYNPEIVISLSEGMAALSFANPPQSNQDMVLQLEIQETILFQSGTLQPGTQVSVLELADGASSRLSPGGYDGTLIVLYYDPETTARAILRTEIPVNVTVME